MKSLGKRINSSEETIEAYACACRTCSCSCSCYCGGYFSSAITTSSGASAKSQASFNDSASDSYNNNYAK